MHFSAKTILQIHGRLNRLGQTKAVKWHNLKVKNSFHDHQERVVTYDRDGIKMDYYTEGIIKLGHACSALAKLTTSSESVQYWTDNDEYLMVALTKLVTTMTLDELEEWLACDEAVLRTQMEAKLEDVVAQVKTDETAVNEAKLLKQKVDEHERELESNELVNSGDMEGGGDFEEVAEFEEEEIESKEE
ncbi:hypothetical protein TASIC1_0010032900 [Trichoderma asperellum]|uniref:Uncharacterized protein n=1 Tax=Trichoderma asperellum TaxID=101201 RepID=A0A6V8R683_TRIAP|nr:hypothetical protein LI328DRAFT_165553 [Trichoderma asperelloides]GFP58518.1 hypothetical protein TASIC1_0010032900 [Trichoderma asperellum]